MLLTVEFISSKVSALAVFVVSLFVTSKSVTVIFLGIVTPIVFLTFNNVIVSTSVADPSTSKRYCVVGTILGITNRVMVLFVTE